MTQEQKEIKYHEQKTFLLYIIEHGGDCSIISSCQTCPLRRRCCLPNTECMKTAVALFKRKYGEAELFRCLV